MMHRTSIAFLVLLLAPVCWLGELVAGETAMGAKARRSSRTARAHRRSRSMALRARKASSACPDAYAKPTPTDLGAIDAAVVCLVNLERRLHGLQEARPNGDLDRIAGGQAADMVAGGYFGDNSLSGRTPLQRAATSSYGARSSHLRLGQNIGWGCGRLATPAAIVAGWMRSAPHRQIMLTPAYRDIGASAAARTPRRGRGATYVLELASKG